MRRVPLTYSPRHPADALEFLLPLVDPALLAAPNAAQSTPLHWAALNRHLAVAQALVGCARGPGVDLIDAKNAAGRTPLGEAENAGWDEYYCAGRNRTRSAATKAPRP